MRAYDWLLKHGVSLVGYDPLAPAKERRAALTEQNERLQELDSDMQEPYFDFLIRIASQRSDNINRICPSHEYSAFLSRVQTSHQPYR